MGDTFGYSFTPGLSQQFTSAVNGQSNLLPPNASTALQILSLRLPQILGGSPIAPDALLRPQIRGSSSSPDAAVGHSIGIPTPPGPPQPGPGAPPVSGIGNFPHMPGPGVPTGPGAPAPTSIFAPPPDSGAPPQGPPGAPNFVVGAPGGGPVGAPSGGAPDIMGLLSTLFGPAPTGGGAGGGRPRF